MVSLAIAETSHARLESPTDQTESLRDSALWFPDVPASHLYLNETCFTGVDTPFSEFRPLCYTSFIGSGLSGLRFVTNISVLFKGSCIMAIDFHYDTGNIRRLGYQSHQLSEYETSEFLLDGAHGELLEMIEVDLDTSLSNWENPESFWKYGKLRSFKVSTCSHTASY